MKKILAFAGSNHSKSIHHQLITFTSDLFQDQDVNVLDIRDWKIPIYSIDMDPDETPIKITELIDLITAHDGFIIASPEHNGGTPAFLKNILDWLSRRSKGVFDKKPVFLMSTSPGAKGGATNLTYLIHSLPYQNAVVPSSFSLSSFYDNFKDGAVVGEQLEILKEKIQEFITVLNG